MVRDLDFPVRIEVCPIVREADGLALSSRNAYLSPEERKSGLVLYRSLMTVKKLFDGGERDSARLIAMAQKEFADGATMRLDYFQIVDPDTLESQPVINRPVLVAVAGLAGKTRLIDNILLGP